MVEAARYWMCSLAGSRGPRFWVNGPFATEDEARAFGEASGRVYLLRALLAEAGPAHERRLAKPVIWRGHPWAREHEA